MSYGNAPTIIILDRPGTTLILGEDLDDTEKGVGANGVGKTVILNALTYALYDKPISDIKSKDYLINNVNKKNMIVTIEFDIDGKSYKIERARKTKAGAAGNHVHFYKDDKDITPDSMPSTNSLIEQVLGIPYDLFVRIVAFSATHTPFLDLPVRSPSATNQSDVIEELFDLKTLSEKASLLKEEMKETDAELKTCVTLNETIRAEHERHEQQIESAQRRVDSWVAGNKQEIKDIVKKLKRVEGVDIDEQKKFYDELKSVESQITEKNNTLKSLQTARDNVCSNKNKCEHDLEDLKKATCPYCKQEYDAEEKIKEVEKAQQKFEQTFFDINQEVSDIGAEIHTLEKTKTELESKITISNIDELINIKNEISQLESRLNDLMNAKNPFVEPLEELKGANLGDLNTERVEELRELSDHQKFLHKLLTKKDSFVRKALLNKNIPFLNQRLALYLSDLGLSHTVEFTHEMTANITQFGRPMDFGNLSNGQRARVNLALSFAFRDVLESMHTPINICVLDEVLDVGLDTVGVQAAARMLKRKSREEKIAMYIISHRDEVDSAFDHKLTVQLSKGFSYITYDDQ